MLELGGTQKQKINVPIFIGNFELNLIKFSFSFGILSMIHLNFLLSMVSVYY